MSGERQRTEPRRPPVRLLPGEVHIWTYPDEPHRVEEFWRIGGALLSTDERRTLDALPNLRAARRWCLSRVLIRGALAWHLQVDPRHLTFARTEAGRPYLVDPDVPNLDFSLSHAADAVLFAVAGARRIGIDLEPMDRAPKALRIARRYFRADEIADIAAQGPDAARHALMHWLLKEAVVKAAGSTVWDGLSSVNVAIGERIGWRTDCGPASDGTWQLAVGTFRERFLYAVAHETDGPGEATYLQRLLGKEIEPPSVLHPWLRSGSLVPPARPV